MSLSLESKQIMPIPLIQINKYPSNFKDKVEINEQSDKSNQLFNQLNNNRRSVDLERNYMNNSSNSVERMAHKQYTFQIGNTVLESNESRRSSKKQSNSNSQQDTPRFNRGDPLEDLSTHYEIVNADNSYSNKNQNYSNTLCESQESFQYKPDFHQLQQQVALKKKYPLPIFGKHNNNKTEGDEQFESTNSDDQDEDDDEQEYQDNFDEDFDQGQVQTCFPSQSSQNASNMDIMVSFHNQTYKNNSQNEQNSNNGSKIQEQKIQQKTHKRVLQGVERIYLAGGRQNTKMSNMNNINNNSKKRIEENNNNNKPQSNYESNMQCNQDLNINLSSLEAQMNFNHLKTAQQRRKKVIQLQQQKQEKMIREISSFKVEEELYSYQDSQSTKKSGYSPQQKDGPMLIDKLQQTQTQARQNNFLSSAQAIKYQMNKVKQQMNFEQKIIASNQQQQLLPSRQQYKFQKNAPSDQITSYLDPNNICFQPNNNSNSIPINKIARNPQVFILSKQKTEVIRSKSVERNSVIIDKIPTEGDEIRSKSRMNKRMLLSCGMVQSSLLDKPQQFTPTSTESKNSIFLIPAKLTPSNGRKENNNRNQSPIQKEIEEQPLMSINNLKKYSKGKLKPPSIIEECEIQRAQSAKIEYRPTQNRSIQYNLDNQESDHINVLINNNNLQRKQNISNNIFNSASDNSSSIDKKKNLLLATNELTNSGKKNRSNSNNNYNMTQSEGLSSKQKQIQFQQLNMSNLQQTSYHPLYHQLKSTKYSPSKSNYQSSLGQWVIQNEQQKQQESHLHDSQHTSLPLPNVPNKRVESIGRMVGILQPSPNSHKNNNQQQIVFQNKSTHHQAQPVSRFLKF